MRLLLGYMWTHPGKKLLFMGGEFGQWREWSEARQLDWHLLVWETHQGLQRWTRDLNAFYQASRALWELDFDGAGFQWINADDADNSVYSYVRYAQDRDDFVVVVCNYTPLPRSNYRIGVPQAGTYREVMNSDAVQYGGGNVTNPDPLEAAHHRHLWWDTSLTLTLPPLGIVILQPVRAPKPASDAPRAGETASGFGLIDLPAPQPDPNAGLVG
jgi:1,4-alpha-glucan branching enzyme